MKQQDFKQNKLIAEVYKVKVDKVNARSYVQIKLEDGSIYGSGVSTDNTSENIAELDYKLFKYRPDSVAHVQAKDNFVAISGSEKHRFVSHKDYGNFVVGPTSFTAHPESIRIGSVYRINGLHTSTLASTIVTPMPLLILDLPGENLLSTLSKILQDFKKALGL